MKREDNKWSNDQSRDTAAVGLNVILHLFSVHVVESLVDEQTEGSSRKHPRRRVHALQPRRGHVHEHVGRRREAEAYSGDQVGGHPRRQQDEASLGERAQEVLVQERQIGAMVFVPAVCVCVV